MLQTPLFDYRRPLPPYLETLLNSRDTVLALGCSGGKDSQALINHIVEQNYSAQILVVHADVGERVEWPGTKDFICHLAAEKRLELFVVKRKVKGKSQDLFDYIEQRQQTRNGDVFWMTPSIRYCTSTFKTQPINKFLRQFSTVINLTGIRALESPSRAKKSPCNHHAITSIHYARMSLKQAVDQHLTKPLGRLAIDWKPLFDWNLDQVWQSCGTSTKDWERRRTLKSDRLATKEWPCHYAYVVGQGNTRLSCAFCMIASINDLTNAIPYNPKAYAFITNLETKTGYSYQQKRALKDISPFAYARNN